MCIDCKHFISSERLDSQMPFNFYCGKLSVGFEELPPRENYISCQEYRMKDIKMDYSLKTYLYALQFCISIINDVEYRRISRHGTEYDGSIHYCYDNHAFMVEGERFFFYEISHVVRSDSNTDLWIIFVKSEDFNNQIRFEISGASIIVNTENNDSFVIRDEYKELFMKENSRV